MSVFSQCHGEEDERCWSKLCGWCMKIFVKSWGMLKVAVTRRGNTCTHLREVSSAVRNPYSRKADMKSTQDGWGCRAGASLRVPYGVKDDTMGEGQPLGSFLQMYLSWWG